MDVTPVVPECPGPVVGTRRHGIGRGDRDDGARAPPCTDRVRAGSAGGSKAWRALWRTDWALPDDEVVRIDGKRWAIETFFTVAKSLLGIPREYPGRSYEGGIAHVTLVCIRYQWLALEARKAEDVRTIGDLFFTQCQELQDITFAAVMDQIMAAFAAALNEYLDLSEDQLEELFQRFLAKVPASLRERMTRYASIEVFKAA